MSGGTAAVRDVIRGGRPGDQDRWRPRRTSWNAVAPATRTY